MKNEYPPNPPLLVFSERTLLARCPFFFGNEPVRIPHGVPSPSWRRCVHRWGPPTPSGCPSATAIWESTSISRGRCVERAIRRSVCLSVSAQPRSNSETRVRRTDDRSPLHDHRYFRADTLPMCMVCMICVICMTLYDLSGICLFLLFCSCGIHACSATKKRHYTS